MTVCDVNYQLLHTIFKIIMFLLPFPFKTATVTHFSGGFCLFTEDTHSPDDQFYIVESIIFPKLFQLHSSERRKCIAILLRAGAG